MLKVVAESGEEEREALAIRKSPQQPARPRKVKHRLPRRREKEFNGLGKRH